jgi:hypothetical protein
MTNRYAYVYVGAVVVVYASKILDMTYWVLLRVLISHFASLSLTRIVLFVIVDAV